LPLWRRERSPRSKKKWAQAARGKCLILMHSKKKKDTCGAKGGEERFQQKKREKRGESTI